ncbi:MAG: hypothetical protein QM741_17050 [Rudaea sp.]|uniref:hypothetical protein n=1 Tax=Rudaea sp. TaxID=2136325 RepID=UPI0039E351F3
MSHLTQHSREHSPRYLRQPWTHYGFCGKSKWYDLVEKGLLPPPRKLGSIATWPANETDKAVDTLLSNKEIA